MVLKGSLLNLIDPTQAGQWNNIQLQHPEIDLMGNDGYVVAMERVCIKSPPDSPILAGAPQSWVHVETMGLTSGRIIESTNWASQGVDTPGDRAASSSMYADWFGRSVHEDVGDTTQLFEPTGPTQEYVVPHDKMQFPFQWRVSHRRRNAGLLLAPPSGYWVEITFAFYPNNHRAYA